MLAQYFCEIILNDSYFRITVSFIKVTAGYLSKIESQGNYFTKQP